MTLPELPIPMPPTTFPLQVPEAVHPFIVHFAVALPFFIILIELVNLFSKKRTLGVLSFVFMVILTLILYAALLTGKTDAETAKAAMGADTKALLLEHKQWGIYLFYASVVLMLIKLLSVLIRNTPMRFFFLLVLFLFAAATLATGKRGGELVYTHGVNVGKKAATSVSAAPEAKAPEAQKAEAAPVPAATEKSEPEVEKKAAAVEEAKPEAAAAPTTEEVPAVEEAPKAENPEETEKASGENADAPKAESEKSEEAQSPAVPEAPAETETGTPAEH